MSAGSLWRALVDSVRLPVQASTVAAEADRVFYLTLAVTGAFLVLVLGVLAIAVVRFRASAGAQALNARDSRHTWRTEAIYAAIPAAFLLLLAVVSERTWARIHPARARTDEGAASEPFRLEIVGEQFAWNVRYPGPDGVLGRSDPALYSEPNRIGLDPNDPFSADDVLLLDDVFLPLNRPTRIILRAKDVVHGFYVPEFRIQQNAVPGAALELEITPTLAGRYELICNQFCGLGHYRMKASLMVGDATEFPNWLQSRSAVHARQTTATTASAKMADPLRN